MASETLLNGISAAAIVDVDTAAHLKDGDKLYIQTVVNGKPKLQRVSTDAVIEYALARVGLAYDTAGGQLCAVV